MDRWWNAACSDGRAMIYTTEPETLEPSPPGVIDDVLYLTAKLAMYGIAIVVGAVYSTWILMKLAIAAVVAVTPIFEPATELP